jgi:carbamoyl-phosphate synthase large subunit
VRKFDVAKFDMVANGLDFEFTFRTQTSTFLMRKNILVTSAGRRVSLVKSLQKEVSLLIGNSHVFTTDMNPPLSAAGHVSDGCFKVPHVSDEDYIDNLLSVCLENDIGIVIPTIDTELLFLSEKREVFEQHDIAVIVSDKELVSICRDKRLTNELFLQLGISIPAPINRLAPTFPLFLKPYDGSLSRDIHVIQDQSELIASMVGNEKLMFMEYLNPADFQEYTVDAYFNVDGMLKCLVPRNRLEVRGGEISKGRTEKGELYDYLVEKFSSLPGARGCLTMQFFVQHSNRKVVGIEINPRFGGGYPLTYAAGANYSRYLIEEYLFKTAIPFFDSWKENYIMLRYDDEIFLDGQSFIG